MTVLHRHSAKSGSKKSEPINKIQPERGYGRAVPYPLFYKENRKIMKEEGIRVLGIVDRFQRGLLDIACIVFLVMTIIIVLFQVFNRFWFNLPAPWTEEISRYIFVWLCILGITRGVRDDLHIKVDLVVGLLPKKVQQSIDFFVNIVVILLLTVVLISGLKLLPLTVTRKAATINISMYYLYVGIPASAIVMIIYLLINNVNTLKSFFVSREISN